MREEFGRREALLGGVATLALAGSTRSAQADQAATGASGGVAPSLTGPAYDLRTARDNKIVMARLIADLEVGKQRAGWYNGYVTAVRPDAPLRDLFGFAGFGMSRLLPEEAGPEGTRMWRKVLREVGIYYDLESGEPLEQWLNPLTNERVRVVPVANDPFNHTISEFHPDPPNYGGLNAADRPPRRPFILPWKTIGEFATLERHIHLYYPNALQPDKWPRESAGKMARVSEFFTYFVKLADLQNPKLTALPFHGTWSRVTPWLPWMLMGQAPGHIQYFTYQGSGEPLDKVLPPKVLAHIEKKYPLYLNAPTEWVEPSLSSIERYAREQKPAAPKQ
jgi:hypothetical protein